MHPHSLLAPHAYESMRDRYRASGRAARAVRRVRLDAHLCLLFENHASVWLQVQEELRWIAVPTPERIEGLCARYHALWAQPGELRACLFVDSSDPAVAERLMTETDVAGLGIELRLDGRVFRAEPADPRETGLAGVSYLRFRRESARYAEGDGLLWGWQEPVRVPLGDATRAALLEDLADAPLAGARLAGARLAGARGGPNGARPGYSRAAR